MQSQRIADITQLDSQQWNALVPDDAPFARHEFLSALELSGCVDPQLGWLPQHIIITEDNKIVAAMPFYIKGHSYGEYVFDWAWADAYHRNGLEYYPKGLCAIPFTPASCPKFLVHPGPDSAKLSTQLVDASLDVARDLKLSSVHSLFLSPDEQRYWSERKFIDRTGYQFHWRNRNFTDFDDYLQEFSSSKRKKIRQERASVKTQSIDIRIKSGHEISEADWDDFYRFYRSTIRTHGAMAYLNRAFFNHIGQSMAESVVMILACRNSATIASALFFKGASTLYGRYWGCCEWVKNLHFELCYYRAIEYCIDHKLALFEAGAQGEHKLSRGLLPVTTHSSHWLSHPQFYRAIADHVEDESWQIESYMEHLSSHSPFKARHERPVRVGSRQKDV